MLEKQLVEIAEDPNTSPKTLTKLATLTDGLIVECVAMHPNTPSHIIEKRLKRLSGVRGRRTKLEFIGSAIPLCAYKWCGN